MNKEIYSGPRESSLSVDIGYNESYGSPFKGEIFWELRDGKTGKLQDSGHFHNIVTKDASILIARLIKSPPVSNTSEPKFGAFALAVGTGDIGWDPQNPPPGTNTQRSLFNEIARKQLSTTSFIDQNGNISSKPTNVIDVKAVFSESEAVGSLTELGIIGGDVDPNMAITNPILPPNGTYDPTVNVVGKDMLVNYKTFIAQGKPAGSTLGYTWRFTF